MIDLRIGIVNLAKDLKLKAFSEFREYINEDDTIEEVLYRLLQHEKIIREDNSYKYRLKKAGFPVLKTLDTFEFNETNLPHLNKDTVTNLANCNFVKEKTNVVAIGNCGTGKSHLMTGICIEAIQKGYTVKFKRVGDLVTQMIEASSQKRLAQYIKTTNSCDVLYLDELGYLAHDVTGASFLFQVLASRYETKSTIITSNLEFSKWSTFLGNDDQISDALIGRLVQNSAVLNMNGENYRLRNKAK